MRINRNSQVTVFLIIGVVLVLIVVSVLLLARHSAKKSLKQETLEAKEAAFDLQPISNFVQECLSSVSKDALIKLGNQGGKLFTSQNGPVPDYTAGQEGFLFINFENSKVSYSIQAPKYLSGKYSAEIPGYPWETFPYKDESMDEKNFEAKSVFGMNKLTPLNRSFASQSMQEQLEAYVKNNIDGCLDFSIFEEQGFGFSKKEKEVAVSINEDDVAFRLKYPITIEDLATGAKAQIRDFQSKHGIRLGRLHRFANWLIENDVSDISFNIASGNDEFDVDVREDAFKNDDIIIITDRKASLENRQYKYIFARKNRNPALFYLSPQITIGKDAEITVALLKANHGLDAIDPDEDNVDDSSFSIEQAAGSRYRVKVTDGILEDYLEITIAREG